MMPVTVFFTFRAGKLDIYCSLYEAMVIEVKCEHNAKENGTPHFITYIMYN